MTGSGKVYEPKPGTGWRQGIRPSGGVSWALMLVPGDETGPILFVSLHEGDVFEISHSPSALVYYDCPGPADIQRVELDFGVDAWRVKGFTEAEGRIALWLQAVRVR